MLLLKLRWNQEEYNNEKIPYIYHNHLISYKHEHHSRCCCSGPWGTESYHVYTEITVTDDASALISPRSMQSKTVTKTSYYRDSNNNTMWYLSVTATFNYNGVSAVCANSSHNAVAVASGWSIKSSSSGHNGNAAAAVATATEKHIFSSTDHSMTVTLTCDPDGTIH